MAELIRKPHLLKKVQSEIRAVVGDKERVQPEDVPKVKYLKMMEIGTMCLGSGGPRARRPPPRLRRNGRKSLTLQIGHPWP